MLLLIEYLVTEYDLAHGDTYLNVSVQLWMRLFWIYRRKKNIFQN